MAYEDEEGAVTVLEMPPSCANLETGWLNDDLLKAFYRCREFNERGRSRIRLYDEWTDGERGAHDQMEGLW